MGEQQKHALTESDEQAIQQFLDAFDGDFHEAIAALYTHGKQVKSKPVQVKDQPVLGDVIVSTESLKKQYKVGKQQVHALNGVSISVRQGEFVALTGPSGSGKSTLLQLIGGLDKASSGSITIDGVEIGSLKDRHLAEFRNKTVGFVFQFFYLQPFLSVAKNVEVPGMFARSRPDGRHERVKELLDAVDLAERADHLPKELSGGQMQRAAIARALLNQPKILLADEPTGNLDSVNSKAIIELFEKIRQRFGTTIIMVTHDKEIAAQVDREIRLKDGEVVS
ncbi:ABC transporter ATP-binding protein [Candidatus Saccharibacteria bacterium]|nr:ABC transporter ATP-binding protein [Candidatus Saccharibacteria bacterium]